mgnify:CR=1 FL=1
MATEEEIENARRLREEYNQLKQSSDELTESQQKRLEKLEEIFAAEAKNLESIQKQISALQQYQSQLQGIGSTIDGNLLKRQVARDLLEKELDFLKAQIKTQEQIDDADLERIAALEKQLEVQDDILDVQQEMNKNMRQTTSLVQAASKAGMKLGLSLQNPSLILGEMNVGFQKLGGFLTGKFIDGMVGMIKAFDETSKAFETNFAMGQQYEEQLGSIYGEQARLGVSMEELTKGMGDLITNFTDFTMLAPAQREELAKTATVMQESYGVATQDFAKGIQFSTKMMGMGAMEAKTFQGEIVASAQALGVAPQQLSAQFAQMGPQLAKFGTEGGKTFKELARLSKITGMEMGKILAVTNKFDTFEGAAEQAGQLNAALGGNFVNAMDLMMATDPAERFNMIRDAILDTGLTFDTMSYYQKQFYTNALGLSDVGDLALMLSGNTQLMADAGNQSAASYKEQAERAKALMTIQETLQSIFLSNADTVEKFANGLASVARKLADNAAIVEKVVVGYIAYQGILALISFAKGAMAVKETLFGTKRVAELAQIKSITGALKLQTQAQRNLNKAKTRGAQIGAGSPGAIAGGMSAPAIAAIGAALIGLGLGFMAAGKGVAFMAEAMQDMSVGQIAAMAVPIAALAFGMKALAVALIPLAPASAAAAKPLMMLSVPILAIGAAIGIAAAGIGYMAAGFSEMFTAIEPDSIIALGGMFASLALGAPLLLLAGVGLGAMAVGMGALGLALKFIATDDLQAIALFTESLAGTSVSEMKAVVKQIKLIAKAIDEIDTDKAIMFDAVLNQTALTATAVSEASRTQRPISPTNTGTNNNTAAGTTPRGKIGEVLIKFDTDLFENKVISIYEEADGLTCRDGYYE